MKLKKYENNPVLKAKADNEWESLCVLNPAAWYENGTFYLLYRAAGNDKTHYIHLGLATSKNGFDFTRSFDKPVFSPDLNGPDGGCVEDPRIVKFGDYFYITYAARAYPPGQYWLPDREKTYNPPEDGLYFIKNNNTLTYLAMTKDFISYKRLGRITDSRSDNRDVILFPEKVNGKYVLLSRPMEWCGEKYGCGHPSIWISFSDDMMEWTDHKLLYEGKEWWEDKKVGGSAPPLRTEKGWLTIYHGVNTADGAYRVGALLLDINDPTKILAKSKDFIMEPEFEFEASGYYNSCVFPTGNVIVGNTLYVYYGAADKYCCVATCDIDELLDYLTSEPQS